MELIQNGTFATGEPVYQIAEKNSDGTHTTVVFDPMTKEEAEARLKSMGGMTVEPVEETVSDDFPNYESMTKLELEAMMREYGVELDRRKSKGELLKEVDAYFADED
jgi:hypothetical protein